MHVKKEILLVIFWLLAAHSARAEECGLKRYASLDITEDASGRPLVPVRMGREQGLMMVDTGGAFSEITSEAVDRFKLETRPIGDGYHIYAGATGDRMDREVSIADFGIGDLNLGKWVMMVRPKSMAISDPEFLGLIGPDILRHFDLDFDFAKKKLNLMSQDHCPGKVVYWSQAYASVPFDFDETGHARFKVTIDGQELNAILDTGAGQTIMLAPPAAQWFGISADSPNVVAPKDGVIGLPSFHLHSLTLSGVPVENPQFFLAPDQVRKAMDKEGFGSATKSLEPIIIGANIFRQFHLYIAYGEHKLYVTPASAN